MEDCYAVIHRTAFIIFKASQVFMYIRGQTGRCLHISPTPLQNFKDFLFLPDIPFYKQNSVALRC